MMPSSPRSRQAALRRSRRIKQWRQALATLEQNIETELVSVHQAYQSLHDRYDQIKTELQDHHQIQQQIQTLLEVGNAPNPPSLLELQAELNQLQTRLTELELSLHSSLFSWEGFTDIVWLAVRFGGIGIIVGWLLNAWTT